MSVGTGARALWRRRASGGSPTLTVAVEVAAVSRGTIFLVVVEVVVYPSTSPVVIIISPSPPVPVVPPSVISIVAVVVVVSPSLPLGGSSISVRVAVA